MENYVVGSDIHVYDVLLVEESNSRQYLSEKNLTFFFCELILRFRKPFEQIATCNVKMNLRKLNISFVDFLMLCT